MNAKYMPVAPISDWDIRVYHPFLQYNCPIDLRESAAILRPR